MPKKIKKSIGKKILILDERFEVETLINEKGYKITKSSIQNLQTKKKYQFSTYSRCIASKYLSTASSASNLLSTTSLWANAISIQYKSTNESKI